MDDMIFNKKDGWQRTDGLTMRDHDIPGKTGTFIDGIIIAQNELFNTRDETESDDA